MRAVLPQVEALFALERVVFLVNVVEFHGDTHVFNGGVGESGVPAETLYVGYALFVGRAGYRIGSAPEAARQRPERCRRE